LGQDELAEPGAQSVIERELEAHLAIDPTLSEFTTERLVLGAVRVGQHRFATDVLHNCGDTCVFCGFAVPEAPPSGLLRASHVKPWRDSSHKERLDIANGLAACPTHDAAFDTGLLTVADDLTIVQSARLLVARAHSPAVEQFFGVPPLHPRIQLPAAATVVDKAYLDWHQAKVFVD
jgi:putative restriction endonuclease